LETIDPSRAPYSFSLYSIIIGKGGRAWAAVYIIRGDERRQRLPRAPFSIILTGSLAEVHTTLTAPKPEQAAQLSQERALSLAYRAGWRLQLQLLLQVLRRLQQEGRH